jgi:ATP-dependent protease HslVU (ClpYQ) peptidase subunit
LTVIAWDSKILAADKMALWGDTIGTITKIRRLANGVVVASAGGAGASLFLMKWYEDGANPEKWPQDMQNDKDRSGILIVAGRDGCFFYESYPVAIPVEDPFKAWGCGREAALGAMEMGADAIKAVEIASKWVYGCGRGCDWFEIRT